MAIEQKKLNICRVCLNSDDSLDTYISLFQEYKTTLLCFKIVSIANVQITEGDGFPDKICPNCLVDLETAINFKQRCETSYTLLQSSLLAANPVINDNLLLPIKDEINVDTDTAFLEAEDFLTEDIQTEEKETIDGKNLRVKLEYPKKYTTQCNDCGEFFKSKCKLRVHWKKVHKPKSYICQVCKRLFKSLVAYNKHRSSNQRSCMELVNGSGIRVEGEGKTRIFCCPHCDYKSNKLIHTKSHLVVHSGVKPFKCDLCPKAYTQRGPLDIHKENVHSGSNCNTDECHVCGKMFNGRRRLYRHLKVHTEPKYQCDVCKAFVKGKKALKVHMVRHSGSKNMTCELCAAAFYTSAELCNHRKTHKGKEKHFKCNICEYKAATNWLLKRHAAKHAGDKPYPCTMCGGFFSSLQTLSLHQLRHFEKKFSCPMCQKTFFRKRSISKHIICKHNTKSLVGANRTSLKVKIGKMLKSIQD